MLKMRTCPLLLASAFSIAACAAGDDPTPSSAERDQAIAVLQQLTGAPVTVEVNEAGTTRVIQMTAQFPVQARSGDPATAAAEFVAANHDLLQLSASDAAGFVTTGVDVEPKLGVSHVTL